ncbi:pilus assembly protein TadG-related protein [Vibrio hannami]|uniref:TadE/TadG family type IV pilus assembly protein n=1 Tax=Vibrio hannami TaxID=2717094 RepID=UPI003EBF3CF1
MRNIRKQKGHAALIVAIVFPALWMMMSLATDGSRALQSKARLDDAIEAATLAVAARNDPNVDDSADNSDFTYLGKGSKSNQTIAKAYVSHYMTDMSNIISLDIEKEECKDIDECVKGLAKGGPQYYQFTIKARTKHDTWLPIETTFGDDFQVASSGSAIKYQSSAIDVVLVSDYSGSMYNYWSGTKRKYLNLVDIIKGITDELERYNSFDYMGDSYVAFVGYNHKTSHLAYSGRFYYNEEIYNRILCLKKPVWFNENSFTEAQIFQEQTGCSDLIRLYIDNHGRIIKAQHDFDDLYEDYPFYFYDLPLTKDYATFNKHISDFYPEHGTSSYQGLVRGAQLAAKGSNPRRLIILLSDGLDNSRYTSSLLVNNGLCTKITSYLNKLEVDPDGDGRYENVSSTIAVIGFNYEVSKNTALRDCAGESNVYKALNQDEVLQRILELISDEFGYLKN